MTDKVTRKKQKCRTCKQRTMHARVTKRMASFEFLGHAVLIVITLGIWLPVFLLVSAWYSLQWTWAKYRCERCGR
jgi:uncharacterized protein (DUF983 family)